MFVFVKQVRAYELRISDCSSVVCSSDLPVLALFVLGDEDESVIAHRRRFGDVPARLAAAVRLNREGHFELGVRTAMDEAQLARHRFGGLEAGADGAAQDMFHVQRLARLDERAVEDGVEDVFALPPAIGQGGITGAEAAATDGEGG